MVELAAKLDSSDTLGKLGDTVCGALTAGDLNAVLKCYEPDATVVFEDGQRAIGRDEIGKSLATLITQSPTVTYKDSEILESGDLALIRHTWTFKGNGPDGNAIDQTFEGTGIARRQESGEWLVAIDSPYNAD